MLQKRISQLAVATGALFLVLTSAMGQEKKPERLKWHDSYAAARQEAEATGKPIFVEFRCAP